MIEAALEIQAGVVFVANREPICGFCWAYREVRQPLEFRPKDGWWECPLCQAKVVNPTDDEDSLRRDLLRDYDPDPGRHEKTISSTIQLKGGGSNNGRRRKKPNSRPSSATLEEDARLIKKHNERMLKETTLSRSGIYRNPSKQV